MDAQRHAYKLFIIIEVFLPSSLLAQRTRRKKGHPQTPDLFDLYFVFKDLCTNENDNYQAIRVAHAFDSLLYIIHENENSFLHCTTVTSPQMKIKSSLPLIHILFAFVD